jgi:hypothetical protein
MQTAAQTHKHLPTVSLPAPPVTVAALDAAAEADPAGVGALAGRVELLDGLCVLRPWPTPLRTRVTQRLADLLAAAAPSGAWVHPHGVGVQVSARTLLIPDIVVGPAPAQPPASVPGPTGPAMPDQPAAGARAAGDRRAEAGPAIPSPAAAVANRTEEPPFLVVEVADENTRRYTQTLKLEVYRERAVPSFWLVDPDPAAATATVEVYDLVDGAYLRTAQASGPAPLTVTRPFPVTIIPADLIDPGD